MQSCKNNLQEDKCTKFYCDKLNSNVCCNCCMLRFKCRKACWNDSKKCNVATSRKMSRFEIELTR